MGTNLVENVETPLPAAIGTTAAPPWLTEMIWPFPTRALQIDGPKVVVANVGSGPVLLFANTGLCSIIWRDAMPMLAADFRCVSLDAPGTGLSERPPAGKIDLESSPRAISVDYIHIIRRRHNLDHTGRRALPPPSAAMDCVRFIAL